MLLKKQSAYLLALSFDVSHAATTANLFVTIELSDSLLLTFCEGM